MKKLITLLTLAFFITLSLSAETAFWSGEENGESAYTDKFSVSSILNLQSETGEVTVTVTGGLGKTLEKREIGLSREVLTALGLWGKGDTAITVTLLKGEIKEMAQVKDKDGSGWYEMELEAVDRESALESYKALVFNSLKPEVTIDEGSFIFTIPFIAEYEKEETEALVEKMGFSVKEVRETLNPYL